MNTASRVIKLEKKMDLDQPEGELCVPIIPMSPELKAKWPKGLPYPILGGASIYGLPEDTTK